MAEVIGYRRVSSAGQNLDRQELPDVTGRVFEEKATGANRDRPQLYEMIEYVRDGDEVHVHSIDRLARSLRDLEDIVGEIIGKGASIRFLKEGLHFRPDEKTDPFQKLMFQMLGSFAEFERTLIASRRDEGIAKAKAEGKYKGRQPAIPHEMVYAYSFAGIKADEIAKLLGIGRASVFRIVKKYREENPHWLPFEFRYSLVDEMLHHIEQGCGLDEVLEHLDYAFESEVLQPLMPLPKIWSEELLNLCHSEKDLKIHREILVEQITVFDEMYHMNGPIEYTPRRMQWLLDHGKGHDVISERTGMPIEAISALIKAHKEQHQS